MIFSTNYFAVIDKIRLYISKIIYLGDRRYYNCFTKISRFEMRKARTVLTKYMLCFPLYMYTNTVLLKPTVEVPFHNGELILTFPYTLGES